MAKYCEPCLRRDRRLRDALPIRVKVEQIVALERAQGGVCAICGRPPQNLGSAGTKLNVDHCHKTGKLRGMLCFNCNVGLGHLREDRETFAKALAYLDYHATQQALEK